MAQDDFFFNDKVGRVDKYDDKFVIQLEKQEGRIINMVQPRTFPLFLTLASEHKLCQEAITRCAALCIKSWGVFVNILLEILFYVCTHL